MKLKTFKRIGALAVCVLAPLPSMAQQTYQEIEQLTVNENVTTVITATEQYALSTSPLMPLLETSLSTIPSVLNLKKELTYMPMEIFLPL